MDEALDLLRQKALHARREYRAGNLTKEEATAAIKPYITAWNKLAKTKAQAEGMRAPTISVAYFLEAGGME